LPGRARVPFGDNGTPPYFGLSRELWTGVPQALRKPAGRRQWENIGWKLCVKDKWVDQEDSNYQDQLKYQSEQSVNQVIYEGATTRQVVGSHAVGSI